ncbi:hypothetical protein MARI_04150 [Marinobacter sp. JH2]|nr:hypothetical protein [Marinobacter sp. JH2]QBM16335.1 hypothetical protein MARI_04150 [Marinobacter sp. JH2]
MRFKLASLLSVSLLVTACGGGDSAIDGARNTPNLFGSTINALDDFSPGSTGDSSNAKGLKENQVRVTMEVPANYAPNGEATRRNLRIVVPDRIQVYRTNHSLQKLDNIEHTGDDGHFIVGFKNGLPIGPDVVIETTWNGNGGITMKALAADSDRDVKVNPFSHFVVEEILGDKYQANDFQTVMDCVNDAGGGLCLNKYVWATLADQVHDFEIDIPSGANLSAALDRLRARVDFSSYVDDLAEYALLNESTSGSVKASSADYNSVFFGLELGGTLQADGSPTAGLWGLRTAQEVDLTDNKSAFLYPALTLTTFDALGLSVTSLATDIPYNRQTISHSPDHQFITAIGAPNSHSSAPGPATLTPKSSVDDPKPARLLAGRALYQTITYPSETKTIGWTRNPYYFDAFTTNPIDAQTGPDRVLASYFTAGKAISLNAQGNQLKRSGTLENHYLSTFELHLLRSDDFDVSKAEGNFNAVYFTGSFGGSNPVAFESGVGTFNTGEAAKNELSANISATTFTVSRSANGSVTPTSGVESASLAVANRRSKLSDGPRFMGRLNLCSDCPDTDYTKPDVGQGAASPDGSLLAFNLDDSIWGDGLLVAGKAPTTGLQTNIGYRIQGSILAVTTSSNDLQQVNDGILTFTSNTEAELTATGLNVSHEISNGQVRGPKGSDIIEAFNYTTTPGGSIALVSTSSGLELQGFYTGEADQIFLTVKDASAAGPRTGLLIATLIPD